MAHLREHHGRHAYTLWYLFFLITYCGVGIYFFLDSIGLIEFIGFPVGIIVKDSAGNIVEYSAGTDFMRKVLLWYLHVSKDVNGELTVIFILLSAVIFPQILSFLISGLFGCGMPPILVSRVTKFAILSLIKFLCVFSALAMSEYIYQVYADPMKSIDFFNQHGVIDWRLTQCLLLLSSSFNLSVLYSRSGSALGYIADRGVTKNLSVAWAYMTRFTDRDEELDAERKLHERLEAHRDLIDIALLITSLGRLAYRNVVRAADGTDSFSEAISVYRQLLKEGNASIYADRTASLIEALWGMSTTKEKK